MAVVRDTRVLPSQDIQRFYQARLVRVTYGRLAIWLNPLRGAGSAGRRESVSAAPRTYGVGEA